jgi:hypothetical protein
MANIPADGITYNSTRSGDRAFALTDSGEGRS